MKEIVHIQHLADPGFSRQVLDFLSSKPPFSVELFYHFTKKFFAFGAVPVEPTKTTLAFGSEKRVCYIYQFGKKFMNGVFYFDRPYEDNLCFSRSERQETNDIRIISGFIAKMI